MLPGYLVEERGSVTRRREMAHLPGREEGLCHQVARCLLLLVRGGKRLYCRRGTAKRSGESK